MRFNPIEQEIIYEALNYQEIRITRKELIKSYTKKHFNQYNNQIEPGIRGIIRLKWEEKGYSLIGTDITQFINNPKGHNVWRERKYTFYKKPDGQYVDIFLTNTAWNKILAFPLFVPKNINEIEIIADKEIGAIDIVSLTFTIQDGIMLCNQEINPYGTEDNLHSKLSKGELLSE